jgi:hypothetical protein
MQEFLILAIGIGIGVAMASVMILMLGLMIQRSIIASASSRPFISLLAITFDTSQSCLPMAQNLKCHKAMNSY